MWDSDPAASPDRTTGGLLGEGHGQTRIGQWLSCEELRALRPPASLGRVARSRPCLIGMEACVGAQQQKNGITESKPLRPEER
jgi:hypothetical protein